MLAINFNIFPELSTERLLLRRFRFTDASDLLALRGDEEVMKFIPRPRAKGLGDAGLLIHRFNESIGTSEAITWAVTEKGNDKVIGTIGFVKIDKPNFRAEVGYLIRPDYQGQGLMQEALTAVMEYGVQKLLLRSMEAIVHPLNVSSSKLLIKKGFKLEASHKDFQFFEGKSLDADVYMIYF